MLVAIQRVKIPRIGIFHARIAAKGIELVPGNADRRIAVCMPVNTRAHQLVELGDEYGREYSGFSQHRDDTIEQVLVLLDRNERWFRSPQSRRT